MSRRNAADDLKERIDFLQNKREEELDQLKEQLHLAYENLKPVNALRAAFRNAVASPALKNNLLNKIIGLATGYLSKRVSPGSSRSPIKKVLGKLLQLAVAKIVSKHSGTRAKTGSYLPN